jgi:hypothetical protein
MGENILFICQRIIYTLLFKFKTTYRRRKKYEVEGRTDFISLPLQPKGKTERSFRVYIPQMDAK